MALERTISIIKPDAVAKNVIGDIYNRFEKAGLRIVAARMMHLSREQAGEFYAVHKERPFYNDLVAFMTSGPVIVQVLEGESAIAKNRELMGATNPQEAAAGTIRADHASTVDENAVHGSDGPDTAAAEMAFFFPEEFASVRANPALWLLLHRPICWACPGVPWRPFSKVSTRRRFTVVMSSSGSTSTGSSTLTR